MALPEDQITDAQIALVRKLAPAAAALDDATTRTLLATTTARIPQRDPVTGEVYQAAFGPITTEVVDPYAVLADLWELEGMRLAGLAEQPRRIRSEANGDVSRSYDGGGPVTANAAYALARRMRRKALADTGARTVEVQAPYVQAGYPTDDPALREVTYQDPAPVPMNAPYQTNRPEPRT